MAISYNTGTTAVLTSSATPSGTVTIPAGVLSGDMILVLIWVFTTATGGPIVPTLSSSATAPVAVVTQTTGSFGSIFASGTVFSIAASASDPGATLTYGATGGTGGSYWFNVGLVSYTGAGGVDVSAGNEFAANTGTLTITTPSATTVANGDWQVQLAGIGPPGNPIYTTPSGLTLRQFIGYNGGLGNAGLELFIGDSNGSVGAGGTAIGNTSWTQTGGGAGNFWNTAFTVGLAPPSSGPTGPPAVVYGMRSM